MAKLYVGKGKGRQGFAEYVMPAAWLRRFVRKGRMRVATEEEAARYALAETKRPVRLIDLPVLPQPAPMPEEESETEITEDDEDDEDDEAEESLADEAKTESKDDQEDDAP